MLEQEDFLQAPRIQALKEKIAASESDNEKRKFLAMLAKEIIKAINATAIARTEDSVNVNNFDEITASLRNELARANKPLQQLLSQLNITAQQQSKLMEDIESKAEGDFKSQFQPIVIKRPRDIVQVDNLHEIEIPDSVSVNNLSEVCGYLEELIQKISALKLDVTLPAPQVTVNPTPVTIPETIVNAPAVNLEPIISALEKGLKPLKINDKSHPLAVRMTDGGEWIKEFKKQAAQTTQFMSDVSYIRDASGQRINPATAEGQLGANTIGDGSKNVTTAGTRVQLTSSVTPCRYVIVVGLSTNTDMIWLGGSTVAAGRGRPLVALQSEKIDINDVSKVYIDSVVNGEGVSFAYVN